MSAPRKQVRADLKTVIDGLIAAGQPLAGARVISAWAQNIDANALPAVGIATPSEQRAALSQETDQATITAVVVIKRRGGDDLEDDLDDDAEALIPAIEAGLKTTTRDCALTTSAVDINGAGSPRVGTLTLTFQMITFADRPVV
jgi:hypothetical protein